MDELGYYAAWNGDAQSVGPSRGGGVECSWLACVEDAVDSILFPLAFLRMLDTGLKV